MPTAEAYVNGPDNESEAGIALIAVLWVLMLLSLVAFALSLESRTSTIVARNMADNAAVRAAANAGIQRAILDLLDARASAAAQFRPDGTVYLWRFANSTIHLSVQNQLGKVDLNKAPPALLTTLLELAGVDPTLADTIADFRDADDFARPNGAEKADYRTAGLAWGPKNAPFEAVEELQQVLGVTAPIYKRVSRYLTTYSLERTVDPNMASKELYGLLRRAGFRYFIESQGGHTYSIRSEAKSANGAVFVREAIVQIIPGSKTSVLDWKQG